MMSKIGNAVNVDFPGAVVIPKSSPTPRPSDCTKRAQGIKLLNRTALVLALAICGYVLYAPKAIAAPVLLAQADPAAANGPAKTVDPLPKLDMDGRMLFQLLLSEIAAQRGMADQAATTELNLAKETRDPRIARRATELALIGHQANLAAQSARLWSDLAPHSEEANDTLVTILVLSNRLDEAEPLLREYLAQAPAKPRAFAQLEATLARSSNHAAVLALVQRLAVPYPAVAQAHVAIAQSAHAAGDDTLALEEARRAAMLEPDAIIPVILTAQLLQQSTPDASAQVLRDFLTTHPKSTEVRMTYARLLIAQKRYDDASAQFKVLLQERPNDADMLYTLGLLAFQAEKPDEAEAYFKHSIAARAHQPASESTEAVDADNDDDTPPASARSSNSAYLYLAQIALDKKDDKKALQYLAQIQDGDEFLNARIRRAVIISRDKGLEAGRTELHAIPTRSDSERVQVVLGESQLLRDASRDQDAFTTLNAALDKAPGDPDLLYEKAMTAEHMGKLDVMETTLRQLIQLHPENAQAYNALGYTFADHNIRLAEARDLIAKALTLAPDDASIIDSMGWVQYRLGDNVQAIQNLQRAYEVHGDAEIAVHLGEVLWVSGRHNEAEGFWLQASKKDPDNALLKQTLARFNATVGTR